MAKEVILIAVHGMGDTRANFAAELHEKLADRLDGDWLKVHTESIFYQPVLQEHQQRVMDEMERRAELRWRELRKFMLYGFSDAAGLERRAAEPGSPYEASQKIIRAALQKAFETCGPKPVVLVAHSLGAQVMSNYIWDAQKDVATRGVWREPSPEPGTPGDDFLRLRQLRRFYTTGCNIPIIVGGFPKDAIRAISPTGNGYDFRWNNYYDADDVLGWPLRPLNDSYAAAVHADHEINASGSLLGTLVSGWNPFSHLRYWKDAELIEPLAADIRNLMP